MIALLAGIVAVEFIRWFVIGLKALAVFAGVCIVIGIVKGARDLRSKQKPRKRPSWEPPREGPRLSDIPLWCNELLTVCA